MPNYTFRCGNGHNTDALRPVGHPAIRCHCGRVAHRWSVYAVGIQEREITYSGGTFREATEMLDDQHRSAERSEGVSIQPPSLYRAARAKAERWMRQGAQSSRDVR